MGYIILIGWLAAQATVFNWVFVKGLGGIYMIMAILLQLPILAVILHFIRERAVEWRLYQEDPDKNYISFKEFRTDDTLVLCRKIVERKAKNV